MNKKEKIEYLYNSYYYKMHAVAYSILSDYHFAEDACQDTIIKLMNEVDRIPDVTSKYARNLCFVMLRNTAKDIARKWHRQIPTETIYTDSMIPKAVDEYPFETEDMIKDIEDLPELYRTVIKYRCFENKSSKETAALTGSNVPTVNSRLCRAKKLLLAKWGTVA